NAQEVFPDRTPAQEYLQNKNAAQGGILKAGGGTGSGDPIDPGTGGMDPNGSQNDTTVPVKDDAWLLILLSLGYGTFKRRKLRAAHSKIEIFQLNKACVRHCED
ncbi:MAG: hypothetical protein FWD60_13610, partial [Candidatus Azobacteroides sp.]|nr:hypothetical protein [Candidatus Azobacteroides sp.]